jgi:ClpP class serine protease
LKEVLYAADRQFLERYLKEKSAATLDDLKAISDLRGGPIHKPGTQAAVDEIYSLDGNAAHIRIEGPLSVDGPDLWDRFWGYNGASYTTIRAAMERAKTDPLVEKVIFDIDSPGGTLAGVDETHAAIKAAGKPTETRAGSLLASAAYWLAAATGEILASSPASEIGSIGVLVATYDFSKMLENDGVKRIVVTSSKAPDKHVDLATDAGKATIKTQLDALERIFYARISEGRGVSAEHIAEKFGKGGLLVAWDPDGEQNDALKSGMIDGLLESAEDPGGYAAGLAGKIINALNPRSGEAISPATAGTGGNAMTLQEFMAQGPAAKAEADSLTAKAREEAQAEYSARVDKVLPIIQSASYPANIKTIACNVLSGKEEMAAFTATVATFDAQKEAANSAEAQAETAKIGAVGAEAPDMRASGEKEMDAALQAELDKRKVK